MYIEFFTVNQTVDLRFCIGHFGFLASELILLSLPLHSLVLFHIILLFYSINMMTTIVNPLLAAILDNGDNQD